MGGNPNDETTLKEVEEALIGKCDSSDDYDSGDEQMIE